MNKNKLAQLTPGYKRYFRLFNSGLLLVPGFFNALLVLLLSSNRLFPDKAHITLLLLNISQLLSFGITVAKYAADQMILSKLNAGERASLRSFFLKRVIPLALLFSLFTFYSYGLVAAAALFICIPVEVFIIITILELNVSGKYFTSLKINLLGYPLIFIIYITASKFIHLHQYQILLIFIFSSAARFFAAFNYRINSAPRQDVLVTSPQVPLQQSGNYLLFKIDQVIIASNILQTSFFKLSLPGDYLFYSKFSEVFSGVATSLGPILAKIKKPGSDEISAKPLLKNKFFLGISLLSVLIRLTGSVVLLKTLDSLHLMMLIPFTLATLLIVPVNMINYELYRTENLQISNKNNLVCIGITVFILFANTFFKSPLLFAWMVPAQLMLFILLFYLRKKPELGKQQL